MQKNINIYIDYIKQCPFVSKEEFIFDNIKVKSFGMILN